MDRERRRAQFEAACEFEHFDPPGFRQLFGQPPSVDDLDGPRMPSPGGFLPSPICPAGGLEGRITAHCKGEKETRGQILRENPPGGVPHPHAGEVGVPDISARWWAVEQLVIGGS
jgi:hypothetical protein